MIYAADGSRLSGIAALASFLLFAGSCSASDCGDAIDTYNNSTSDISFTLQRYARCVSDSQGADDCSSEFRRLRNAQSDFESAVASYHSYCES